MSRSSIRTIHRCCAWAISTGEVAEDRGDFSGMPIVEAARLEAAAEPGKTLANSVVRTLVGTRRAFRFRDVGPLTLKGIPAPLSAVEVLDDQVLDTPPPAPPPAAGPSTARSGRRRWPLGVAAVVVLVLAAAVAVLVSRSDSRFESVGGDQSTRRYHRTAGLHPAIPHRRLSGEGHVGRVRRQVRAPRRPRGPRQTGRGDK